MAARRTSYIKLGLAAMVVCQACSSTRDGRHSQRGRDPQRAHRENSEGLSWIEKGEFEKAQKCFQEAIANDLYHAAAHNNLGIALLDGKRYYEAAWQFERAAKLAPRSPEPRNNLGLLYERIGRLDEAAQEYDAALEIDPQNLAAMRHLARAYVKADRRDDELRSVLERLLLQSPEDPQWDTWARGQLIRIGRKSQPGDPPQPFGP